MQRGGTNGMKSERFRIYLFMAAMLAMQTDHGDNLAIDNVTLSAAGGGKAHVDFDVSWENSWRDTLNYDAVWLFMKFSADGGTRWRHATLADEGFDPPEFSPGNYDNLELWVPDDRKGAMLQRS